jgi:hypothetical protein
LATAFSVSLWQWIPMSLPGISRQTSPTMRSISCGRVPPFEEMLGVEHHLVDPRLRQRHRVGDHVDVFGAVQFQRNIDMEVPGLADHADAARRGRENRVEARIVGGAAPGAPCHAEGDEPGVMEVRRCRKEAVIGRIGTGPAAFDIVDADAIEFLRDGGLVRDRKIDALGLGAVAQCRIEQVDTVVGGHRGLRSGAGFLPPSRPAVNRRQAGLNGWGNSANVCRTLPARFAGDC